MKITYEIINFNIKEREVFDIKNDPNEFNNIVNTQLFKNDREQMYIRAQKRLNKILEYVKEKKYINNWWNGIFWNISYKKTHQRL